MYGAIESGKPSAVVFAARAERAFVHGIVGDDADLRSHLVERLRPEEAECFDEENRDMIRAAVSCSVGWPELKRLLIDQLNTWTLLEMENAVTRAAAKHERDLELAKRRRLQRSENPGNRRENRRETRCENRRASGSHEAEAAELIEASDAFADLLNNAGNFMLLNGQLDVALSYYEKCVAVRVAAHGTEERADCAETLGNIAGVYKQQRKPRRAAELMQRSLEVLLAVHGTEQNSSIAQTLHNQGGLQQALGRLRKATETLLRSLRIKLALHGTEDHESVVRTLRDLAEVYVERGKLDQALALYKRNLHICTRLYATQEHPAVAEAMNDVSYVYQQRGGRDLVKALAYCEQGIVVLTALHGDDDVRVGTRIANLAILQRELGRRADALASAKRALRIFTSALPDTHPYIERALADVKRLSKNLVKEEKKLRRPSRRRS